MKTVLKLVAVAAILFVGAANQANAEGIFTKIKTETGDYCRDQALGHLRHLFGEAVEIQGKPFSESGGDTVTYWIKTNLCDGYMVASYVRQASCATTHYGSVPLYMKRLFAMGSCQQLLPSDSYPAIETVFPFLNI